MDGEQLVGQDDGIGGEVADAGAAGEQITNQQQSQGQATRPNWDDEANPYRAKFTGLQGNFKQVHQENQRLRQEMLRAQQEMALLKAQMDGRTPEEIASIKQSFEQAGQLEQMFGVVAQEAERTQLQRQMLAPVAKQMVLDAIAKQYGIDAAELADANTPQEAEFYARKIAAKQRTNHLQQRKEAGIDQAEQGGGGNINWDKLSASEKIRIGVRMARK